MSTYIEFTHTEEFIYSRKSCYGNLTDFECLLTFYFSVSFLLKEDLKKSTMGICVQVFIFLPFLFG